MKPRMIIIKVVLILLFSTPLFAQEIENKFVEGLVYSEDEIYLMLDNGYLRINQNNFYEEYYRKIYNDSTVTNPNTVISNDVNLNIIPFLNLSPNSISHKFNDPVSMGVLLDFTNQNGSRLTPFAQSLIDSVKAK